MSSKREKGFSLVEMTVMAAVAGAASLGMLALFQSQGQSQKKIQQNYDLMELGVNVSTIVSSEENCTAALRGINPSAGNVNLLKVKKNSALNDIYPVNEILPSGLQIVKYEVLRLSGMSLLETNLRITVNRRDATNTRAIKNLPLQISLDTSGNILTCYAVSNSAIYWKRSVNNPSNIFYQVGNVGVGNPDPKFPVDVQGDVRPGPPGVCDADSTGSVAYDPAVQNLKVCNGTSWDAFASTSTLTTFGVNCDSSGSTGQSLSLGTHKLCLLKKFQTANMGRDDHTRGACDITESAGIWNLEARCREARTECEAICRD